MAPNLRPLDLAHSVPEIERALAHLWADAATHRGGGEHHVAARSSVLNLVVVAGRRETAERCAATIEATAGRHPSRSLILSALDVEGRPGLDATIQTVAITTAAGSAQTGAETIYVTVHGQTSHHLASIIVPLLVHDLPVALWWPRDPQFLTHRAERLLPIADRLIVDGSSWSGDGLDRLGAMASVTLARRLAVADFALLRQARWREALASVYDLPDLRPHLRAVRSIAVEFAAPDERDSTGLTNIVRPVYHVAWLASRLGMSVVEPMRRLPDGRRIATLRQGDHAVAAEWRPVCSDLGEGSTVRVEIVSRLRGAELVGDVAAGDRTVDVAIHDKGRERVRRTYLAPRLGDVDLLERALEDSAGDSVAIEVLAMAGHLIAVEPAPRGAVERRGSRDHD
ncbi:MAG: glucose-6-phosphate dehydrogenase assembly protein OpcA [Candidatus Limnocylindrales bacterium]|jgi:glucose-6-phosphate dehydrogenase assembly protein OpcA